MICLFDRYRPIALCTAFFTAYVIIRTVPQSINGQTRQKKIQVGEFHILCSDQLSNSPVLSLVERPLLDHGFLRRYLKHHPHHRQLIESYLSPCLPQCSSIEIEYFPRAMDRLGRKYCNTVGGQRMPRFARLLLFGGNHCEIDLKGLFYELVRRLGLHYVPDHTPLPAIEDLRAMLLQEPTSNRLKHAGPRQLSNSPLGLSTAQLKRLSVTCNLF